MPLLIALMLPLADIATFIVVGRGIGVLPTLFLVAASFALGCVMLRDVGVITAVRLRRRPDNVGAILADGGARVAAGLLLIIPGFLTNLLALAVLTPPVRLWALSAFRRSAGAGPGTSRRVIEGDYRRLDD